MSKSYGNFTDPNELMDTYSADSLRFLLLQSPLLNGEDFALIDKDVADVARKLSMVWNMYDFFTLYAEVDDWEWNGDTSDPSVELTNPLDQWIVSRVHQLNKEVDGHMQGYDVPNAMKPILPFIEDASNWYVRRSRKRFWKSDNDGDKQDAYKTLHYVLVQLSIVLAPFVPFLAEELYQKLTGRESVHLLDWPEVGHINETVLDTMSFVQQTVNEGLSQRAKAGIKVRQPLPAITVSGAPETLLQHTDDFSWMVDEELNVKRVNWVPAEVVEITLDTTITPELKREGLVRDIIRFIQNARKEAGCNVEDHIKLALLTDDEELAAAISEFKETIEAETLSEYLQEGETDYTTNVKVEGVSLAIGITK